MATKTKKNETDAAPLSIDGGQIAEAITSNAALLAEVNDRAEAAEAEFNTAAAVAKAAFDEAMEAARSARNEVMTQCRDDAEVPQSYLTKMAELGLIGEEQIPSTPALTLKARSGNRRSIRQPVIDALNANVGTPMLTEEIADLAAEMSNQDTVGQIGSTLKGIQDKFPQLKKAPKIGTKRQWVLTEAISV